MTFTPKPLPQNCELLAYIVGLAIGDGNLSSPNGRATRLRITCDMKYPRLAAKIMQSLRALLPGNKVSIVPGHGNYFDISCYSKHWEQLVGWRVGQGSKVDQGVSVPSWIKQESRFSIECLRGLLETDGSIYVDRGCPMVIFSTVIPRLAQDVHGMVSSLGFLPHTYQVRKDRGRRFKYHVRISRGVPAFLDLVRPEKQ